jgi:hypothetical protein
MISDSTRREFMKILRLAAAIGLLPEGVQAVQTGTTKQGPTPAPLPAPTPSELLQSASNVIELRLQDMDSTAAALHNGLMQELNNFSNGPTISTQNGPAKPYVPGAKGTDSEPDEGGEEKDFPQYDPNTKMPSANLFEPSFDSDAY